MEFIKTSYFDFTKLFKGKHSIYIYIYFLKLERYLKGFAINKLNHPEWFLDAQGRQCTLCVLKKLVTTPYFINAIKSTH